MMNREAYDTDLSDASWSVLEPYIPPAKPGGRPRTVDIREVVGVGDCYRMIFRSGKRSMIIFGAGVGQGIGKQ